MPERDRPTAKPRSPAARAAGRPPTVRKTAQLRRRDIADAALATVAEEGLSGFTAVGIARRVGVSDAALFRHFATKHDIVLAAIDRVEELLFPPHPPLAGPPLERLGRFFRHRAATLARHPGVARLLLSEVLEQVAPAEGVRRIAEFKHRTVHHIRACLAEAQAAGELAPSHTVDTATVVVLGAVLALVQAGSILAGSAEFRADAVWAALEACLGGGHARGAITPSDGPPSASSLIPSPGASPRAGLAPNGKDLAP